MAKVVYVTVVTPFKFTATDLDCSTQEQLLELINTQFANAHAQFEGVADVKYRLEEHDCGPYEDGKEFCVVATRPETPAETFRRVNNKQIEAERIKERELKQLAELQAKYSTISKA